MRFCPFCSAENPSEASQCASCGRRLPPLPPRRQGASPTAPPPVGVASAEPAPPAAAPPAAGADGQAKRALLNSLVPPPSSQRRDRSGVSEVRSAGVESRRRGDVTSPLPPPPQASAQPAALSSPPPEPAAWLHRLGSEFEAPTVPRARALEDDGATEIRDPFAHVGAITGTATVVAPAPGDLDRSDPTAPPPSPSRPISASDGDTVIGPEPRFDRSPTPSAPQPQGPAPGRGSPTPSAPLPLGPPPPTHVGPRPKSPSQPPVTPAPRPKSPSAPPAIASTKPRRADETPDTAMRRAPTAPPPTPGQSPVTPSLLVSRPKPASGAPPTPTPMPPKLPPTPVIAQSAPREPTQPDPPPTRIARPDALIDRPFTPPQVLPLPALPEAGPVNAARYTILSTRARWQRRGAIRLLHEEIRQDTSALDIVLGTLGRAVRTVHVDNRVLADENHAIDAAEQRRTDLDQAQVDLASRKNDEISRWAEIERERVAKVTEGERSVDDAQGELANYEAQRRGYRDKRKDVERRQKAYLKAAEDRDGEAEKAEAGETHQALRRQAEEHRREAAGLEPERQEIDRKLAALERPVAQSTARVDATKAELEAAKRSLNDAREGHRHRLAEIEAEQARKTREQALAEAEIQRRLVTLGTLVNLNRIERPEFVELYQRVDRLRGAIGARQTEIEKLTAEREAVDRAAWMRGAAVLGSGVVVVFTLIVILIALV